MSDENRLIEVRRQKVAELRASGENPYANNWRVTHTSAELKELAPDIPPPELRSENALTSEDYRVAGRVMAKRSAFLEIWDREGRLQLYFKTPEQQARLAHVERGDFVGAQGHLFYTKRGKSKDDLALFVHEFALLTKSLRPLPEKWHGLQDVELRYRQRYVDLISNRADVAPVFRSRARIISHMRSFFDQRGFLEVETPILQPTLGGAAARPFQTHHNTLDVNLYLRIAPELYLKRLVVGGFDRVYEIGHNFRNEGIDRIHNPEFTMLEFYQAYATFQDLIELTEELLCQLATLVRGGLKLPYQGSQVDFSRPWPRVSMLDIVHKLGAPIGDVEALRAFCSQRAEGSRGELAPPPAGAAWGELIGWAFDNLGERTLDPARPTFVVDYPVEISPLSRKRDSDPRLVDRFELFILGREHANAFSELNDPDDQRARFAHQLENRARGDAETMDYDEDYCRALEYGMPPTAGEGIGIDRLVMLLCDQPSIRDVVLFPQMRPE
ncbi:MAG TPA: lysine--tRNA ligase [Polyangia bacterium]|nr:lysine--tRNA ligase [Polyangia bacterium]